jgi:ribosomal protein S18 acetylase RimI-like enzyme
MIHPALASSEYDLKQILELQQQNLQRHISNEELLTQGFVTLQHDLATLTKMHELAPSVVVKDNDKVMGYALTMLKECRQLIPDLEPMFVVLDSTKWQGKSLADYNYYVMGQVCITKAFRGQGIFDQLYAHHKKIYQPRFDLLVTEIATRNHRSIRAHERIGFKTIRVHRDELDEWAIVAWDWQ